MKQTEINYKSDFNAILALDGGWNVPFRAKFWTGTPSRSFIASFDGSQYNHCHIESDGRLCVGFDHHDMGTGKLMLELTFYLDSKCFADGVCSEVISAFAPIFVDSDGTEYEVVLGYKGASTLTTIGTLPAFYQRGEKGDKGERGEQGIPGIGEQGPQGERGPQGFPGIPGERGERGEQGPAGKDGKDGKDGSDGSIIYPVFTVDEHNMHLYVKDGANRIRVDDNGHIRIRTNNA